EVFAAHMEDDPDRPNFVVDRRLSDPERRQVVVEILAELAPPKSITLRSFRIARAPVTNEEFAAFCQATGRDWTLPWRAKPADAALGVSWEDASAYAAWTGARLPTADEWECAARGPGRFLFPWGNDWNEAIDHEVDATYPFPWPPGERPALSGQEGILDLVTG